MTPTAKKNWWTENWFSILNVITVLISAGVFVGVFKYRIDSLEKDRDELLKWKKKTEMTLILHKSRNYNDLKNIMEYLSRTDGTVEMELQTKPPLQEE